MVDAAAIRKLSDRELNDAAYRRRLVDEIARQGGDLEDEILAALAQRLIAASLFDEAEGIIASEAIAPLDKIDLLIVLADALQAGGEAARADGVVAMSRSIAVGEEIGWQQGEALLKVGRLLGAWGRRREGMEVVTLAARYAQAGQRSRSRQDALDASSVLAEAAELMAELGDPENARATAGAIRGWTHRRRAKARIAALESR
jgi:hypothetical protein